jgi:GrpB-like predicted nucleotidyltransferase (UPF0157 family)
MEDSLEVLGGRERRAIEIVAYDAAWPSRFELERTRIDAALGAHAVRIDHIGSTAIPGLAAKPIIDIQVSVADPAEEAAYVPPLEAAGYVLRVRERGHRMLRTAALDVHVHICTNGGEWERRHLLFRDWLRVQETDAERYAEIKRVLAGRDWADMNEYAQAKTQTVSLILQRAEAWARRTSWTPS